MLIYTGTYDPFIIKETFSAVIILICAGIWGYGIVSRNTTPKFPELFWPCLFYLGAILLSLKNAVHAALVWRFFFQQCLLILIYVFSAQTSQANKLKVFNSLALATLCAGIYGIIQTFNLDFIHWKMQWGNRPSATFGNPNFASGWWVMSIPIIFGLTLNAQGWKKYFYGFIIILALAALYLGRTRGAYLALTASLVAMVFLTVVLSNCTTRIKIILIGVGALVFSAIAGIGVYKYALSNKDRSVEERLFKWRTAQMMIIDHPVLGVGAGNLKTRFALYQQSVRRTLKVPLKGTSEANVHNEFLQIGAEMGLLGLTAYLSIIIFWFIKSMRVFGLTPNTKSEFNLALGTWGAVLAFQIYSLTNFPLHITPNATLLFFLLGWNESPNVIKKPPPPNIAARSAYAVCASIIILYAIGYLIYPSWQAQTLRQNAETAKVYGDYPKAAALFQKSIAADYYQSERAAYELGETYRALRDIPSALNAYLISVSLRNYGEVYNNIGNCYYLLGDLKNAKNNWEKALQLELPEASAQIQTEHNLKIIAEKLKLGG